LPGAATEPEKLQKLRELADKLAAIEPDMAERHTALSECKFIEHDWHGAEEEIVRSIQLNPKSPVSRELYAFYLSMLARSEEAHLQMERARELDVTDRTIAFASAWPFMAERRFDQAIAQLQRVLELDKHFPDIHNFLGQCYEAQSNYVAAMDEYKIADLQDGQDPARVNASYTALRHAYEASGQTGYFRKYIDLIHEQESLPAQEIFFSVQELAGCYAMLGDKQKALDELEKRFVWHHLKFEPLYDSLHDEPRFKALLKRAGFEN
jgi:tetratricopeptide (TPR) repeat protein